MKTDEKAQFLETQLPLPVVIRRSKFGSVQKKSSRLISVTNLKHVSSISGRNMTSKEWSKFISGTESWVEEQISPI